MIGESAASNPEQFDHRVLQADAQTATDALAQAGQRAPELVARWIALGNAAAVAAAAENASGAARKAARRGLSVLKSRGVPIPQTPKVARLGAAPAEPTHEAWMLPPDGGGTLLLAIVAHAPPQRPHACFVSVNDISGLQRVDTAVLSQSQLKDTLNRAASQNQVKPVRVPVAWARYRIAAARRRHAATGRAEPLGLTTARELLEPVPEERPPHPFDEEGLVLSDEDAHEMAKDSGRLHALPEFRAWLPVRAAVDEILTAAGNHFTSAEPPDQDTLRQRLQEEVAAATDRYFSPQRREQLTEAMKDGALSVLARDGEQVALEVVATMKAIERAGLITHPPHEVGFLRAFFDKGLAVLANQSEGTLKIPVRQASPAEVPTEDEVAADAPDTEANAPNVAPPEAPTGDEVAADAPEAEATASDGAALEQSAPTPEAEADSPEPASEEVDRS